MWILGLKGLRSLSNDNGNGNENGKKAIGLDWKNNNNLHVRHALLSISSQLLHDYDVKLPSFTEEVNARHRFSRSFSELRYSPLERTPEEFPNIKQIV